MTFDEVWEQLASKRPDLRRDSAELVFTAANLQKLLRQVYERGERAGTGGDAFSRLFGGNGPFGGRGGSGDCRP